MSWTYHDYETQPTDAERLARARQFKAEILSSMRADVSSAGYSRSSGSLQGTLDRVEADIRLYERRVARGSGSRVGFIDTPPFGGRGMV